MKRDYVLHTVASHWDDLRQMGVSSLALFGSTARDEARDDSDVDFLVEFDRRIGLFEFIDVQEYLERVLGGKVKVDLSMPDALHEELKDDILREAIPAAAVAPEALFRRA